MFVKKFEIHLGPHIYEVIISSASYKNLDIYHPLAFTWSIVFAV